MAKQLQLIFDRTLDTHQEMKEIKAMIKDAFENSNQYHQVVEKIAQLKLQKKQIEDDIKSDFSSEINKLDTLKLDFENDKMLISDSALTELMKGESIKTITDKKGNQYEPVFTVKFKKI